MPLTATFFCWSGEMSVALIRAWISAGHSVSSVIVDSPEPMTRGFWQKLHGEGVTIIGTAFPVDWSRLERHLDSTTPKADVLVCHAFMRRIPASILQRHAHGGVNFHPSLLPHYRGPNPTRCMIAAGRLRECAGLSLHVMTDDFDAGDLIAQTPIAAREYRETRQAGAAITDRMCAMAVDAIPAYCSGRLKPVPQVGEGCESSVIPLEVHIDPTEWGRDDIAAACAFLKRSADIGLCLEPKGRRIRVKEMLKEEALRSGEAPRIGLAKVRFDCADGQVTMLRDNLAGRLARMVLKMGRRRLG